MTAAEWIDTFRLIPEQEHGKLVLILQNGTELCVDTLFRFDDNFVLLRGRQGGTIEEGRAFVVPYSQLLCLRLDRLVKLDELDTMFGAARKGPRLASISETPMVPVSEQVTPTAPTDPAAVSRLLLERIKAVRANSASRMAPTPR